MNNKTLLIIIIGIVVVGAAAWALSSRQDFPASNTTMMEEEKMMDKDTMMEEDDSMMEKDTEDGMMEDKTMEENTMMNQEGAYKDYSAATVSAEQAEGQKVVLFFHAPWCPFCRAADSAFQAKLDQVPDGVTILKTDYDSNTELKQKYGVTYQHTFVQIDNDGNQVTKWSGGDIDSLVANLK